MVSDDDPRVAVLHACQRGDETALVASAPPGEGGEVAEGSTLDVIPWRRTPIALARWLGLPPAWRFGITEGDDPTLWLDAAVLDARLTAPGTPPPGDANQALVRMWSARWQVATLRSGQPGALVSRVITTPGGRLVPARSGPIVGRGVAHAAPERAVPGRAPRARRVRPFRGLSFPGEPPRGR